MRKRIRLGQMATESFDNTPTGGGQMGQEVTPAMQAPEHEQPLTPTSGYLESPQNLQENYSAEDFKEEATELWKKIKSALGSKNAHDDKERLDLYGPVSQSAIRRIETGFRISLPELYVELLKIHNGQHSEVGDPTDFTANAIPILPNMAILHSAERVYQDSKNFNVLKGWEEDYGKCSADPQVRNVQWSSEWILIGAQEMARYPVFYVLDYSPSAKGTRGQVIKIDLKTNKRVFLGNSFDSWFRGHVERLLGRTHVQESIAESGTDTLLVDEDELDEYAQQANNLTDFLGQTNMVAMEAASDMAKSHFQMRMRKLKDRFADVFKSTPAMIAKYENRLSELEQELTGAPRQSADINMSGLWQHFSDEHGPIDKNFLTKVKADLEMSRYILTDFSKTAFDEVKALARALHGGQGNDDAYARALGEELEKLKGPAEYFDQKYICASGERPYLSVTGIYAHQGKPLRPVGIDGVILERLSQLACQYKVTEFGSFTHGLKKLFVHSSKEEIKLSHQELAEMITMGREYLNNVRTYLAFYNQVWAIFRQVEESMDLIWEDFDLVEFRIDHEDGEGNVSSASMQVSGSGPLKRRMAIFEQIISLSTNFSDAVLQPGFAEMGRSLRAAKFHGYLVAKGLKAFKIVHQQGSNYTLSKKD